MNNDLQSSTLYDLVFKILNKKSDVTAKEISHLMNSFLLDKPTVNEIKQTGRLFTEQQLIEFGNYLLSDERRKLYAIHPHFGDTNLEERLSMVNHADILNAFPLSNTKEG